MKRFVFPLAVALCLLALVPQQSTVSAKDTWIGVRTKNFYLVGSANEGDVRKVAVKLEQFREAFIQLFPRMKFNTPVPTTVVVFKNKSAYTPFGPPNTAGYFQGGPDVNYIALSTERYGPSGPGLDGVFNIIFHEYIHLLVDNTFKNSPLWLNEGLAEYYSTFKISDDQKVEIGIEPGNHLLFLSRNAMLPLQTLLAVDHNSPYYNEKSKKSVFYAQSWALMHYLLIGKVGGGKQLTTFLNLIANNVPVETAFPQAFETTFETMQRELSNYVRQDRYNVAKGQFSTKLVLDTITEAQPLTEAEAQAYLGDLLLHSNRPEAVSYLENALKLDPNLGMAHASLGMLHFREGQTDTARASLERAIAANSQHYLAHYYYAYALSRERPGDTSGSLTPQQAAKIREHLKRAIQLRPDFPETYTLMAFVSLISSTEIDESIATMKRVLNESPGRIGFVFMLGQLYMHKSDYKSARPLLEQVAKSSEPESQHAGRLLDQMSRIEQTVSKYGDPKTRATGQRSTSTPVGPEVVAGETQLIDTSDPSAELREVLRKPAAGETQIMAKLVRIECEVKGIFFVFQAPSGLLRLRTKSFDDIEIRTFTADVMGEISCGPRKPVNIVVICYIPNADKRLKTDGALKSVEFVPADFKLKPDRQ
jgi:tetratricopeptide (TPR) repeat protein